MRLRGIALLVVAVLLVAACGGGSDDDDSNQTGPDPARDRELAAAIAFHQYDFPAGWEQIDFAASGSPPTMETLAQCLGPATSTTAKVTNGYHFGPGINEVAVVEVKVLPTVEAAAKVIAPTVKPEFAPCVVDHIKGLLSTSLGADITLADLTGSASTITNATANGVAIDMTAHLNSARGALTSYPAAVFLQRGRIVATVTLLSDNLSTVDLSRTLAAAVANRMPAD
jgi:hypothetical protein